MLKISGAFRGTQTFTKGAPQKRVRLGPTARSAAVLWCSFGVLKVSFFCYSLCMQKEVTVKNIDDLPNVVAELLNNIETHADRASVLALSLIHI